MPFVRLKNYEKHGGTVKRDLLSKDENGVFFADVALLDKLACDKLKP